MDDSCEMRVNSNYLSGNTHSYTMGSLRPAELGTINMSIHNIFNLKEHLQVVYLNPNVTINVGMAYWSQKKQDTGIQHGQIKAI